MSPDRPVPPSVQHEVAVHLALAMGSPLDTWDHDDRAEFERQASVAVDSLRALDPDQRAELLADLAQQGTWPELAPHPRSTVREAVSLAYVANSATLPSLTNDQLHTLADAARLVLGGRPAGPMRVLHTTRTCVGTYPADGTTP